MIYTEIGGGVGKVRQRYPIFPIHGAGNAAFKEVKALQAVVLDNDYDDPITNPDGFFGDDRDKIYGFEMNLQGGGHQHVVYVAGWRVRYYWFDRTDTTIALTTSDNIIEAESDTRNGHAHTVEVWREKDASTDEWIYHVFSSYFFIRFEVCIKPGNFSCSADNSSTNKNEQKWIAESCQA